MSGPAAAPRADERARNASEWDSHPPVQILVQQVNRLLLRVEVPSIQVADGDHAVEPAVSIYDGQMADAAVHHGAAGFVDGRFLGAADNLDRHHVVHDGRGRVTPFADYPPQHVALGEHASDSAVVDHDQSADLV